MQTATTQEIADKTGKSRQHINKISVDEQWEYDLVYGSGKPQKQFRICSLPSNVQFALYNKDSGEPTLPVPAPSSVPVPYIEPPKIVPGQMEKTLAKADLLRLYTDAVNAAGWGNKAKARKNFMRAYNSGLAWPKIFRIIGNTSWKTIEGWKVTVKETGDVFHLADKRGHWRKGETLFTDEQQSILLRCVLHPNKPLIAEAVRMAKAVMSQKGIPNGYSVSTYRRWIDEWRDHNYHIWVFSREGAKAWNDKCAMSIVRDYDLINVGDILVADGHVLNFDIINPWTGKPKRMIMILWFDMKSSYPLGWEIMPTENVQSIASALRRAIMRLGKIPKVAYLDNGKAFGAKYFAGVDFEENGISGVFDSLGIKTIFAWPYHGQSKTVERFFGTFAELERWCPTYTGTSIENKPPRMNRGEFLHRKVHDAVYDGQCLTLEQAHRVISTWFDLYAQRPQRGHLNGACPLDLHVEGKGSGVDPFELRYLMMSMETRHIRSSGIRLLGRNYYHPELHGRRHPVIVRYDYQDPEAIYVFDQGDNFLCMATEPEKVHPAARILGNDDDRERLKMHIAEKKRQEKAASVSTRAFLEEHVLPEHKRHLERLGLTETGPAPGPKRIEEKPISAAEEKRILSEVEQYYKEKETPEQQFFAALPKMNELDRYEKLIEAQVRGWLIPEQWQRFMSYFEKTPTYEKQRDYYENHAAYIKTIYQTKEVSDAH